jgi:hypothetical protein
MGSRPLDGARPGACRQRLVARNDVEQLFADGALPLAVESTAADVAKSAASIVRASARPNRWQIGRLTLAGGVLGAGLLRFLTAALLLANIDGAWASKRCKPSP